VDAAHIPAPQLGRILIAAGLLNEEQLERALEEQARTGRRLGEIIVQRGFISGPALANALAEQHGGVLKTEYGFASGLGGVVARRAASEAAAAVSQLRPPDATAIPQLRSAEPQRGAQAPRIEQEADAPPDPTERAEPTPLQEAPLQAAAPPEPQPRSAEQSPESQQPDPQQQSVPASPPLLRAAEPQAPHPSPSAPELELEPSPAPEPEQHPAAPAEVAEPEPVEFPPPFATPLQEAPREPEPDPEPVHPEPEPAVTARDDRDELIESLRARVEAQEQELAKLRERLEQERARAEVQVHVWPEEQPTAAISGPAQKEPYLLCVPTTAGYVLLDRVGALPSIGQPVDVPEEEGQFAVTKVVRLPRNGRPCAYLQRA
jgi:hypothetical protein